jgi:hypothetical protein
MRKRITSAAALALAACLTPACHKGQDKAQEQLEAKITNLEAKIQALSWRLQGTGDAEGAEGTKETDGTKGADETKAAHGAQSSAAADSGTPSIEQRLAAIENMLNPSSGPYSNPSSIADRVEALEKK